MSRVPRAVILVVMYVLTCQLLLTYVHAVEHVQQPADITVANGQQIIIRTRLIEINRSKMRRLGFDFATVEDGKAVHKYKTTESIVRFKDVENISDLFSSPQFFGFLDALCMNGIARVLAEPTITVTDGCSASLSVGSTVKIGDHQGVDNNRAMKFIGTKLDVAPHLVENNRVRIKLRLDLSDLDEAGINGEVAIPKVRHRAIDTIFEVNLDEIFSLGGLLSKVRTGEQTEEVELVLMVTPELVDGKQTSNQPAVPVSQTTSFAAGRQ